MEPALLNSSPSLGARIAGLFFQSHCICCSQRVESPELGGLCLSCWKRLPWINEQGQATRIAARYEGVWRDVIHAYKFGGRVGFRRPFARLLLDLSRGLDCSAVLGVPCSKAALKERGFDHVEAFARPVALGLGLPYLNKALFRSREGSKQARLKRQERLANAQDAYRAELPLEFRGKSLLLVDDVSTTGATLEACVKALKDAGAGSVKSVVLAAGI